MNEKKFGIPFVGYLEVTVHPNGVDEGTVRDMAIDGMHEYLSKDMATAWLKGYGSAQKPIEVKVPKLIETYPLYIGSAPDARKHRAKNAEFAHAWASIPSSSPDETEAEEEDDVKALIRELSQHGIDAVYMHTGGGCMVAEIELEGGYFLSSSCPDGRDYGYYWGIENHDSGQMMQGSWPKSDAAMAAKNIATLIKSLGSILPES